MRATIGVHICSGSAVRDAPSSLSVEAPLILLQCVRKPGREPKRGELRSEDEARAAEKEEDVFVWSVSRSLGLCNMPKICQ